MKAVLTGEVDSVVGVNLRDNNGAEHILDVRKDDGSIPAHQQDGYPDKADERTSKGNEMVRQARDYAKWYVAQETEYDTVPWYLNTGRLKTVRDAVGKCSEEELDHHFGQFYRQLAGEYKSHVEQPLPNPVPEDEAIDRYREYKYDIYLTADESEIETTSGIHVMYYAGKGDPRIIDGHDPYSDRKPDGRLEHVAIDLERDQFATFLDYHLRCQIRDSYLSRGEEPPEEYRVLGPGTDHMMRRSMSRDYVPDYHDYNGDIDGYRAEDTFNAGIFAPVLDLIR
ncbi:hypothetical protein [Halovivax asiaticus]|nr:hypothetical protein [Halovivax asiaticus]